MNARLKTNTKTPACACVIGGTMVHTKEGLIAIDKLKVSDWVLSRPENPGDGTEPSYKRVVNTFRHEAREIVEFTYEIGDNLNPYKNKHYQVTATLNHLLWVMGEGWTSVEKLNDGRDHRPSFVLTDGAPSFAGTFSRIYRTNVPDRGWVATHGIYGPGDLLEYGSVPKCIESSVEFDRENWPGDVVDDDIFQPFQTTVYNIEVEDFHTYFVGEHGTWVHDANCARIK